MNVIGLNSTLVYTLDQRSFNNFIFHNMLLVKTYQYVVFFVFVLSCNHILLGRLVRRILYMQEVSCITILIWSGSLTHDR